MKRLLYLLLVLAICWFSMQLPGFLSLGGLTTTQAAVLGGSITLLSILILGGAALFLYLITP